VFYSVLNYSVHYGSSYVISSSIVTSIKFIVLIALLVFVRGGIPRYRFDYLTKLG